MLTPTGFWSYTSSDDEHSRGRLSRLRQLLAHELQGRIGRRPEVRIFQDAAAIPPGRDWERQILDALRASSFFIPIVTPSALKSEDFRTEFDAFLARERELGRGDLIFPILYIPAPELQEATRRDADLHQ